MNFKKIEFASTVLTEQYEEIADHFFPAIFGITSFMLTDESSLDDFNFFIVDGKIEREEHRGMKKVEEVYGVDISDVEDLNLNEIFKRLRLLSPVFN